MLKTVMIILLLGASPLASAVGFFDRCGDFIWKHLPSAQGNFEQELLETMPWALDYFPIQGDVAAFVRREMQEYIVFGTRARLLRKDAIAPDATRAQREYYDRLTAHLTRYGIRLRKIVWTQYPGVPAEQLAEIEASLERFADVEKPVRPEIMELFKSFNVPTGSPAIAPARPTATAHPCKIPKACSPGGMLNRTHY